MEFVHFQLNQHRYPACVNTSIAHYYCRRLSSRRRYCHSIRAKPELVNKCLKARCFEKMDYLHFSHPSLPPEVEFTSRGCPQACDMQNFKSWASCMTPSLEWSQFRKDAYSNLDKLGEGKGERAEKKISPLLTSM